MATLNNVITNANGCVGIGTSSPVQLLELKKTTGSAIALLNYNDSVKFNINASSGGAGYVGMVTNHDLIFVTNDTERARLNTNGNLGIGTSSPAYKLEVLGLVNVVSAPGSYGAMFRARDSVTLGTESFGGVHFTSNPGTDYTIGKWTTAAGAGLLQIRDQSGNKFFTIDGAGNVGIGTTTLSSLLTLHGTYPQLVANNPSTGSGVVIQLKDNGRDAGFIGHATTTARLQFGSRGIANTQMTLDYNGNLGIGTTSPTRKLHIDGGATTTVGIYIDANGISGTDIEQSSDAFRFQIRDNIPALFYTNNTERIRITSDGKVGIGTSSPNHILDIAGGTGTTFNMGNSSDSLRGGKLSIISGSATGRQFYVGTTSAIYNLVFGIDSVEKARIDTNGNLGIGTTTVNQKLSIYPGTTGGIALQDSGGTTRSYFFVDNTNPTYSTGIRTENYYLDFDSSGGAQNAIRFYTGTSSIGTGTERMRITSTGNVGIGTTAPATKLDVKGNVFVANAANGNNIIAFGNIGTLGPLNGAPNNLTGSAFLVVSSSTASGAPSNMRFFTTTGGTCGERMRIAADGNVGIGTSTLFAKFVVSNGSGENIEFTPGNATVNGGLIENINRSTGTTRPDLNLFTSNASNGSIKFYTNGVNERMRVASDGNVGIGTTSPVQKFSVVGNIYLPQSNYITWNNGDCEIAGVSGYHLVFRTYTGVTMTEKLRITSGGNVGIGTTVPVSKLEIAGNTSSPPIASVQWTPTARSGSFGIDGTGVYIRNSSNGDYFDLKNASGVARFRVIYDNATHLTTNFVSIGNLSQTGSKLSVFGNTSIGSSYGSVAAPSNGLIVQGSVGIGTTAPSGSLTIQTNGTQLRLQTASGPSAYYSTINSLYDSTHPFSIAVAGNSLTTAEYFGIYADSGGSNPRIALLNGNVGIGTTTPFGTAANRTVLSVNGTTDVSLNIGSGGSQRAYLYGVSTYAELGTIGSLPLTFAPNNSEKMRLNVDGNVGIGTTSPSQKLELNGTSTAIRILSTTGDAYVRLTDNGVRNWDLKVVDVNDYFEVGGTNTTSLVVTGAGNVGIGTTSPAYKLEVNGSLYATRLSGSAMFTTNGKGRFYGTASYALASAGGGSSLTGQTDSVTPFETSLGHQAGNSNTGTGNTAIGYQALFSNTTGTGSIAIGYQALYSNTRGKRNIAIGYEALRTTQGSTDGFGDPIGDENVAIGYQAARAAFNINRVVAIGHRALAKNLAGGNVAIGWLAMESNVGTANSNLGILNTAVGTMALSSNTSGNANSAFGYLALNANTTGNENTAVGHRSMLYNTTGKNNCSFGSYALYYNQIANNNSAFGAFALYSNTTNNNSAFGYKALRYNTTGVNNDAFGYQALYSNISGKGNSAFGFQALKYATTATGNSAFGRSALTQCSGGGRNSAFGYYSSGAITGNPAFGGAGMDNCSFGYRALRFNNSGNNNTAVGKDALYNNKVSNQTAIGYNALLGSTTGNGGNTAVGSNAGSAITFGYRNTMIGNNAGATGAAPLTTGQNNTCLGNGAITSTATVSNEITLGNSSITTLRCQVTTITSLSDIRDKDDIIPVDVGLSFIEKLRPVTFKWDKREWYTDGNRDGSKKDTITQIGFIAQELKALQESENATYLNLVYESNPDKLEATPGNLMIPLIKAVQELNAIVKQQRVEFDDKITKQQLEIDYLKSKLNN